MIDSILIGAAAVLVLLNGFFVAAEFALVKVRRGRLETLIHEGRLFAKTAGWLIKRLEGSLSACQLGITMASLGLGWIGEPALAELLEPVFHSLGISSDRFIHSMSFIIAFSMITAAHLVLGEQAPKLFAIRNPENVLLRCAIPLKSFYIVSYPFLVGLNKLSSIVLRAVGIGERLEEPHHSEEEIRALLDQARIYGELSPAEYQLLHAVFEFDDLLCRRIMVPRSEVIFCDINRPVSEFLDRVRNTKHTRYPVCEDSLDEHLGVLHVKDLVGMQTTEMEDIKRLMRPPNRVPAAMPVSRLLRYFQKTHQLMAFVLDEYGTVLGIVTLENVLEQIVGPVDDEFDRELPTIVALGPRRHIVMGSAPVKHVNQAFGLDLDDTLVNTFSGVIMTLLGKIPEVGDRVDLGPGTHAEVIEVNERRATRIRVTQIEPQEEIAEKKLH